MNYKFRPNLFQKSRHVRLVQDSIEFLDERGHVTRCEAVSNIRRIREYDNGQIRDPHRGQCPMKQCIVTFTTGSSVTLKSASYTGPQAGLDHSAEYGRFVGSLIDRLARCNPDAEVVSGGMGVAVAWALLGVLGLGFLVLGIAMLASPVFTSERFQEIAPLAATCAVMGVGVAGMAVNMTLAHWPTHTTAGRIGGCQLV